jgi:YcxB-like protein
MQEVAGGPFVSVSFTLTFDEYASALSGLPAKWWASFVSLCMLVSGFLFFVLLLAGFVNAWGHWAWIGSIPLVFLCIRILQWQDTKLARMVWQAKAGLREAQTFIFSPSGVQISSAFGSLNTSWKNFVAAEASSLLFHLTSSRGEVYILPKRAFRSPEDRRTFQQLAEAMVPKCRF